MEEKNLFELKNLAQFDLVNTFGIQTCLQKQNNVILTNQKPSSSAKINDCRLKNLFILMPYQKYVQPYIPSGNFVIQDNFMKYVLIVCYSSDLNEDKLLMFFEMKKKEKKKLISFSPRAYYHGHFVSTCTASNHY